MKGVASHFKCANCENKLRRKVPLSEHYNCFRVVSNLDNYAKDTLEKEIANNDIVVSKLDIMATPKSVFVQDKPVAADNFHACILNEHVDEAFEINEVKAALLVKSLFPSLGAPKCPR